ncbi:MAG: DinB family protein [bacterium]
MDTSSDWRGIVASSLDWEQAHAKLDSALANLAPELRGRRPDGLPHSIWELVDHIRRTQHDLLEFCVNPKYHEPKWPNDYWPPTAAPSSDAEWKNSLADIHRDTAALAEFTIEPDRDLTTKIPHGTGQTYLRTVLVAVVHSAHHVAQIIDVRRLLGAWPPS